MLMALPIDKKTTKKQIKEGAFYQFAELKKEKKRVERERECKI